MLRSGSYLILYSVLASLYSALGLAVAGRADEGTPTIPALSRVEMWSGAEAFHHAWSLYGGATVAPFGSIQEDGFRLRAIGGFGTYSYTSPRWMGTSVQPVKFDGAVSFADLLIGYHRQVGPVTLKAFAGASFADHNLADPEAKVRGAGWGGKAVLEAWWTITDLAWASTDLSWGSLHHAYGSRVRLGWRLLPELSVGPEAGAAGNVDGDRVRAGGFVRYEWASGEVSLSGGMTHNGLNVRNSDPGGPFATFTLLARF